MEGCRGKEMRQRSRLDRGTVEGSRSELVARSYKERDGDVKGTCR